MHALGHCGRYVAAMLMFRCCTLLSAGNEKLPPTNVSFQRSTMERLKQKKNWPTALGHFGDMQKHWDFPMKNNLTSKYPWKRSTLYPCRKIFAISLNVYLVIPMAKTWRQKITCCHAPYSTSISTDETKNTSVIEKQHMWNELPQTFPFLPQ